MKEVEQQGAQGDVLFRRIAEIPADAPAQKRKRGEPLIVTHSETGHHHVAKGDKIRMFGAQDSLVAYLSIDGAFAEIIHQRPFDTHETLRLPKGLWEVRRQREHTPEGWRRVAD